MEVVGAVASVIAVVQIAESVINICKVYITGARDAPIELRTILIEVGSVKSVLDTLQLLGSSAASDGTHLLQKLAGPNGPVEGCSEALKALNALFPAQSKRPAKGKRQRAALSLASLAWPFKRDKAQKLLAEIGTHKATISLCLTTESFQDLKVIRSDVEHIRETTDSGELNDILNWLVATDPSPNHNRACELHEAETGTWLSRTSKYIAWKEAAFRFIWFHGIPGAGKTVLFSYVAKDIQSYCSRNTRQAFGCAYYYCYFARAQDERPHMLRWIINQLCRQAKTVPFDVRSLFRKDEQPTTLDLIDALYQIVKKFSRVYLLVDALDESLERGNLLDILLGFLDSPRWDSIQIMATSRKELDIERALLPKAQALSLSNPYVDEDIRTYIQMSLRKDRKFNRWPRELTVEIEDTLVKGAKGMQVLQDHLALSYNIWPLILDRFRWVFCQLDVLKRLNNKSEIRRALSELPETLDETYERVLCAIPPASRAMAYKTLTLLASGHITHLHELQDAVEVHMEGLAFDVENDSLDILAPLEVCTCLVTYSEEEDDRVNLAHYTVQEFLMSPRIVEGPASEFYMTKDSVNFLVTCCFVFRTCWLQMTMKNVVQ